MGRFGIEFCLLGQPNGLPDTVDENIVIIATGLEHGKALQAIVQHELALGGQGLRIVVRNPSLGRLVVQRGLESRSVSTRTCPSEVAARQTYRLAAVIKSTEDALRRLARLVQEAGLGDQAPERVRARVRLRVAAGVNRRVVVPAGALEPVRRVLRREHVERRVVAEGRRAADAEGVPVPRDAQHDLVRGEPGGDPGGDARLGGALVVARVAGGGERGVGSAC